MLQCYCLARAPGINVVYHFSLGMMEGKGVDGSVERVKDKIIPTLKANYVLWPAVQVPVSLHLYI